VAGWTIEIDANEEHHGTYRDSLSTVKDIFQKATDGLHDSAANVEYWLYAINLLVNPSN
jgi:hypothetical protein